MTEAVNYDLLALQQERKTKKHGSRSPAAESRTPTHQRSPAGGSGCFKEIKEHPKFRNEPQLLKLIERDIQRETRRNSACGGTRRRELSPELVAQKKKR